jgi:hypothetical protein
MEREIKNNQKQGKKGKNGNGKKSNPTITIESYETPRFEVNDPGGYKYLGM